MAVDLKKIPTSPGIYKFFHNSEIIHWQSQELKEKSLKLFCNAKKDRKTNQIKKLTDQVETFSTQMKLKLCF